MVRKIKIHSEIIKYFKGKLATGYVLSFLHFSSLEVPDEKGIILPKRRLITLDMITQRTCVSRRTLVRTLHLLTIEGFVERVEKRGHGSEFIPTSRTLDFVESPRNHAYVAQCHLIEKLGYGTGLVYCRILSSMMNVEGSRFYSSNQELAERSGVSPGMVRKSMAYLASENIIKVDGYNSNCKTKRWVFLGEASTQLLLSTVDL